MCKYGNTKGADRFFAKLDRDSHCKYSNKRDVRKPLIPSGWLGSDNPQRRPRNVQVEENERGYENQRPSWEVADRRERWNSIEINWSGIENGIRVRCPNHLATILRAWLIFETKDRYNFYHIIDFVNNN